MYAWTLTSGEWRHWLISSASARSGWRPVLQACALMLIAATSVGKGAAGSVISWAGNATEWDRKLDVGELRFGCSSTPDACLKNLDRALRAEPVGAATIAITPDPENIAAYALAFSAQSLHEPRLLGIGLDDAVGAFRQWNKEGRNPGTLLQQVMANTKASNPHLQFGITVYEDELQSPLLADPLMPATARAAIDRVHLYVHYRRDGPQFQTYVMQVKQLFPKAAVIAGVYAYDRISYLPCSRVEQSRCTPAEETGLFEKTFRIQVAMLATGEVAAIEFYPGNFGTEESWVGWKRTGICEPSRIQGCIEITSKMHDITQRVLLDARK